MELYEIYLWDACLVSVEYSCLTYEATEVTGFQEFSAESARSVVQYEIVRASLKNLVSY